jgi:hypothetical protein
VIRARYPALMTLPRMAVPSAGLPVDRVVGLAFDELAGVEAEAAIRMRAMASGIIASAAARASPTAG